MDENLPPPHKSTSMASNRLAFRVGSEFFSGIILGLGFGYFIDYFFGTKPWGMVSLILLGFAAAFRNVYKLFSLGQRPEDSLHLSQNGENPPRQNLKDVKKDEGNTHG